MQLTAKMSEIMKMRRRRLNVEFFFVFTHSHSALYFKYDGKLQL